MFVDWFYQTDRWLIDRCEKCLTFLTEWISLSQHRVEEILLAAVWGTGACGMLVSWLVPTPYTFRAMSFLGMTFLFHGAFIVMRIEHDSSFTQRMIERFLRVGFRLLNLAMTVCMIVVMASLTSKDFFIDVVNIAIAMMFTERILMAYVTCSIPFGERGRKRKEALSKLKARVRSTLPEVPPNPVPSPS